MAFHQDTGWSGWGGWSVFLWCHPLAPLFLLLSAAPTPHCFFWVGLTQESKNQEGFTFLFLSVLNLVILFSPTILNLFMSSPSFSGFFLTSISSDSTVLLKIVVPILFVVGSKLANCIIDIRTHFVHFFIALSWWVHCSVLVKVQNRWSGSSLVRLYIPLSSSFFT